MAFIADRVLDFGLNVLSTEANRLDICSSEPTSFAEATDTESLGNKTNLTISNPQARSPDGRKVTVAQITDGVIDDSGTATHYAIVDTTNNRLLITGTLDTPQVVTDGNTFTLASFDIGIPGAV